MAKDSESQYSFCTECGSPLESDFGFCTECGSSRPEPPAETAPRPAADSAAGTEPPSELVCKSCHSPNPTDCSFCVECGEPLPGLPEATGISPALPVAVASRSKLRPAPLKRRRRLSIALAIALVVVAATAAGVLGSLLSGSDPMAGDSVESATRVANLVVKHYFPEYEAAVSEVYPFTAADGHTAYHATYSGPADPDDPGYQRHRLIITVDPATSEISFAVTN